MAVAQYYGTGRRKTSVARVRLVPGQGKITVNKKELNEYFGRKTLELVIKQPLVLTGVTEQYDVIADVKGGGPSGQAGAIRHQPCPFGSRRRFPSGSQKSWFPHTRPA